MSVSTDGKISYGVAFEEGFEFPWGDRDIDDWWYEASGFKATFEPWDAEGERAPGYTDERVSAYFKEKREWLQAHPLPVTTVNYCHSDYPMYILAAAGSARTASRGSVEHVLPLPAVDFAMETAFLQFCADYQIVLPMTPTWLLSAYWG